MKLVTSIQEMLDLSKSWRQAGQRIGLVPTMGMFHDGHLALMREAGRKSDKLVVSLFVNPIQFGPNEDFVDYPKDLQRDMELAETQGAHVLYHPSADVMYPDGFQSSVSVDQLSVGLCGGKRPGHFDGVCTVVAKLLNQVRPHIAVFGEKDFQQLAVVRQMVKDLDINVKIIGHPIVRESDGLAMSSRNSYLNREERRQALCLYEAVKYGRSRVREDGTLKMRDLENEIKRRINEVASCKVDYVSIVDSETLLPCQYADDKSVLLLAVIINDHVRLIDNGKLFPIN